QSRLYNSDVQSKENHVAIAYFVIISLQPQFASFACFRERTSCDQIVVMDRFRCDKPALKIGVNRSRSGGRFVTGVNGPCARLFFASGEKRAKSEQMIDRSDERVDTAV